MAFHHRYVMASIQAHATMNDKGDQIVNSITVGTIFGLEEEMSVSSHRVTEAQAARNFTYCVKNSQFERKYNSVCQLLELVLHADIFEALEMKRQNLGKFFYSHSNQKGLFDLDGQTWKNRYKTA